MLQDKVVLITGAASGIGQATAELAANEGAKLLLTDVDAEAGEVLAEQLRAEGTQVVFVRGDVSIESDVAALIATAEQHYGALDCAVNNAGILGEAASIDTMSLKVWQRVIDINLTGVFLCVKHQLRWMKAQGHGAIVNIASGAGVIATPNMGAYCASKHGVLGITKTATQEVVKTGIRVNAVLPGSTRTPMVADSLKQSPEVEKMVLDSIPCGRFGEAVEVAQAIVWLCSDRASYVSGEAMLVDGGTVCR